MKDTQGGGGRNKGGKGGKSGGREREGRGEEGRRKEGYLAFTIQFLFCILQSRLQLQTGAMFCLGLVLL